MIDDTDYTFVCVRESQLVLSSSIDYVVCNLMPGKEHISTEIYLEISWVYHSSKGEATRESYITLMTVIKYFRAPCAA